MNDLYRNALRLYKNFFQPVTKLQVKVRVGSKVKIRRAAEKAPYQRFIESREIP